MLDPAVIGAWIGLLVVVGGAIAGTIKFLFWILDEWQKRRAHKGFPIPRETLRIATQPEGNCWWAMGKKGHEPTMQIAGGVFLTNIASVPIRITQVELRFGFLGRKRVSGMVSTSAGSRLKMHGMYDIPPGETRDASFDFWVYPPVVEPNEPFAPRSLVFTDQFGNLHKVRRVSFRSITADNPPRPQEPEEFPYAMADPVEREIVSVLKAEIARYAICGRRVGGLGSVHLVYQGRPITGVGSDSWTPDSPLNQLIVADPENASLKSDNLEALIGFYWVLTSSEDRTGYVRALLERLDERRGYLGISYFIVCVLWSVGSFADALRKAKHDLPCGETRVFGLSNILMLLNGLLKYRHPDFTNQMLDEIEHMTHGLDEHTFLIPAKIAAIRASRLPKV